MQKVEDQFLSLLSYVAEQEHNTIRMRQREEINIAQRKGGGGSDDRASRLRGNFKGL